MVSLDVVARMADGKELAVHAEISGPDSAADGSAVCRVSIAPLQEQPLDVRGVDSFHAMWLACSLVLKLLTHFRTAGAVLLNPDGSAFPLELYLAGLDEEQKKNP